jgi:hypothetical protein
MTGWRFLRGRRTLVLVNEQSEFSKSYVSPNFCLIFTSSTRARIALPSLGEACCFGIVLNVCHTMMLVAILQKWGWDNYDF